MTMIRCADKRQVAARIAGLAYLLAFPLVVFAQFGIHDRLFVLGNAAATARNIAAHTTLFRLGIACDLAYAAGTIVLTVALYVVFRSYNHGLALLAAFWRFLYALMWVLMTVRLFDALRIVTDAQYLDVFSIEQSQALARLQLSARFDQYYVGLLFDGLASSICSWLWFNSSYVPRFLALVGLISSVFCVICTFAFVIFPAFTRFVGLVWFDTPLGIFEIVLSFWLLFKGLHAGEK